jgi:hypothetical protein
MDCNMSRAPVGMIVVCILASSSVPAKAAILFVNPLSPTQDAWCDPCSISQPSPLGNAKQERPERRDQSHRAVMLRAVALDSQFHQSEIEHPQI